jgi:hypothetical protein
LRAVRSSPTCSAAAAAAAVGPVCMPASFMPSL